MKYLVAGSTARTAAELASVHRNTVVRFFTSYAPPLPGNNRKEPHSLLERERMRRKLLWVFEKGNEAEELLAKWRCPIFEARWKYLHTNHPGL